MATDDSCSSASSRGSSVFFSHFVCGYLANHADVRQLVKLKEDRYVLRFNDVDKITCIYCDFKQANGKTLKRDLKKRKDNFKNIMSQFERDGLLKRVGGGTDYDKEYLKYEIKDRKLWLSLTRNYSVPRKRRMQKHENVRVSCAEPSSDTGLGMTTSDDPLRNEIQTSEKFRKSRTILPISETSSDPGDLSQSDDQFFNEMSLDTIDHVDLNELDAFLHSTESDDSAFGLQSLQINPSTSENEASMQPLGAVDETNLLTIVPDKCPIKGGSRFIVCLNKCVPSPDGTYDVKFGEYGICKASGSGNEYLHGLENIPRATRRGTHSVEVQIFDKATNILIGKTELEYVDDEATELKDVMHVKNPSLRKDGSDHHNERRRPTKKSSSDSIGGAGSNKRFKNCPIDMPMLVYLCDEMAKRGDEHFFSALIKFGIMGKVLENRCEYFKDYAITAQEHGHSELAETITTYSRDVSDQLTETLTFGMLLDAVQTGRSLENSDSVHSSDSDDDPNSCSSAYDGDCDSEDDQLSTDENFEENEDKTDAVHGDCSSECDDDSSRVTHTQKNSTGQNAPSSQAQDSNGVHIMRIQENSAGHKVSSSQIRDLNEEKKSVDDFITEGSKPVKGQSSSKRSKQDDYDDLSFGKNLFVINIVYDEKKKETPKNLFNLIAGLPNSGSGVIRINESRKNEKTIIKQQDIWVQALEQGLVDIMGQDRVNQCFHNHNVPMYPYWFVKCILLQCSFKDATYKHTLSILNCNSVIDPHSNSSSLEVNEEDTEYDSGYPQDTPTNSTHEKHVEFLYEESDTVQLKLIEKLKATLKELRKDTIYHLSNNIDNHLPNYVSAFANHHGGNVYFGVHGTVKGQVVEGEDEKMEVKRLVEKIMKRKNESQEMIRIWGKPDLIPKYDEQWSVEFVEVVSKAEGDKRCVVVVKIKPFPGWIFLEAPLAWKVDESSVKIIEIDGDEWRNRYTTDSDSSGVTYTEENFPGQNAPSSRVQDLNKKKKLVDDLFVEVSKPVAGTLKYMAVNHEELHITHWRVETFMRPFLKDLGLIHDKGYVHADVKPENILFGKDDPKLGDIAGKQPGGKTTWNVGLCGTVPYIPKELVRGGEYRASNDIYEAVTNMLYLLTGAPSWTGYEWPTIMFKVDCGERPEIPSNCSEEMKNVLERMLHPDHKERPTAKEMLQHSLFSDTPDDQFSMNGNFEENEDNTDGVHDDCNSECDDDDQFSKNENFEKIVENADAAYGDCNSECDGDSNRVHIIITHQENSTGQSGPSSQIREQNTEKKSEDHDVSHYQDHQFSMHENFEENENNADAVHGDCYNSECDGDSCGVKHNQENSAGQNAPSSQVQDDQLSTNGNFEENVDNTDVVHGDCNSECDDDSPGVTLTQENSAGQNAPSSQAQDLNEKKKIVDEPIVEDSKLVADLNEEKKLVDDVIVEESEPVADLNEEKNSVDDVITEGSQPVKDSNGVYITYSQENSEGQKVSSLQTRDLNEEKNSQDYVTIEKSEPAADSSGVTHTQENSAGQNIPSSQEQDLNEEKKIVDDVIVEESKPVADSDVNEEKNSLYDVTIERSEPVADWDLLSILPSTIRGRTFRYANMSELLKAVEEGNFQEVKRFIESGADVNERSFYRDETPLRAAVLSGSLEMVKYLFEHGADINCKNWLDDSALYVAVHSGSLEMVKYLVEHGADINCKNWFNETPLHNAVKSCSLEIVKCLVEHGAKVTREDYRGVNSVLWWACGNGNHVIVDYLLQHGAIEDLHGYSPLPVASLCGHTAVVQTLLKYNVDIRKERVLECSNDEIVNILKHELKKSIKHREKIEILKTMDEENMIKVGKALKCCTSEKSLSLGRGCMGTTVYVGIMEDGSEVAVKRMLTQTCEDSARNEIEILTRTDTQKSPYIVSYRDFHHDETFVYLILDLCEETLKEHVHSQTSVHLREHGRRMVKEILTGLEFLHSQGILHRDLKPSNVLVDVASHMRLADFGISPVLNEDETTVQIYAKGTRDWMPVEVIEAINKGQKCRFKKKSDIQVAGMIAFFVLTKGEHPFGSSSVECMTNILKGKPVNLKKLTDFPGHARQFVKWLISDNINDRPYAHDALGHLFMDQVEELEMLPKLIKRNK